jgi:hypothetical protein
VSVLTSTTALYRQVAFTHPVRATNGETARGFYNAPGEQPTVIRDLAAAVTAPTLQLLQADATRLGLADDVEIEIGVLGGSSASGWRRFSCRRVAPLADGLEVLVTLIPLD